jgi:hypothetical protein
MAASFAAAVDAHGGTFVTEALHTAQPLLARSHPT